MCAKAVENLSQARTRYNVLVETRDGVALATDIFLPEGDPPFPTLVGRTPYNKNSAALINLTKPWLARGYAFVVQDCRGRGDSDGTFKPYINEGKDGYDTIQWIAEQPWSDGDVILRGASYGARSSWLTALEKPPNLRGMIIAVSPSDPFVEFPTSGFTPMMISWYRLVDRRLTQNVDGIDWMSIYNHLPLKTLDERAGFNSSQWKENIAHTSRDAYWDPVRYQNRFEDLDVPVIHISGWYDDEQVGTPLNYIGMSTRSASEKSRLGQRMLMGPWGHAVNSSQKLGEVDFGPEAVIDLEGYLAKWTDCVLGRSTEDVPRVRIFVMAINKWRDEVEWPLARTRFTDYFLHSGGNANSRYGDGVLNNEAPAGREPEDVYNYDPARPVPFITEQKSAQIGGPDDYSAIEQRADVLCYTTEPLKEDLEVTGPVKLILFASSSAVDTDFTAKLINVHPTGFCQRICDGVIRARYRKGPETAVLIEPGTVYEFEIDMWNTSLVFKAGHRIRLEVASSAFPKFDRNLNTGESIHEGTRMEVAEIRTWHDTAHPSRLILPVVGIGDQ